MRTVLALIAAVAMIAGAAFVRSGGAGGGGGIGPLPSRTKLTVVCVTELAAACRALGSAATFTIAEAGDTAAELSDDAGLTPDAWLTLAPWPQLVNENRQRQGLDPLSPAAPTSLGRSPLVLAMWSDRAEVLAETCGGEVAWPCLGEHAGRPWVDVGGQSGWGPLKPGHADPSSSASGLLVLGQAVSQFLGRSDFNARDLEDDALLSWLTRLEQGIPGFGSAGNGPLREMVQFGRARFDAVGTTEAEAGPLLERSAQRAKDVRLMYPEPLVVATAVLAPLRAGVEERLAEDVGGPILQVLAEEGWRVEGQPPAAGVGAQPLPDTDNLPAAGALEALRVRTEEITR